MTALQTKQAELIYLICFLMVTNPRRPTIARAQAELRRATGTWTLTPADVERMWPGRPDDYSSQTGDSSVSRK